MEQMLSLSGGQAYGLRSRAGNFTFEQMEEGVQFAAKYGAKVYVAANMVMHEGNEEGAGEWFRKLRDIGMQRLSYQIQPWSWLQQQKHQDLKFTFQHKQVRPTTKP